MKLTQSVDAIRDLNRNYRLDKGDSLRYGFTVTNTGSLRVSNLRITDERLAKLQLSVRCASSMLAAGESTQCFSSTLVLNAFQARTGLGKNFATATAKTDTGKIVKSNLTTTEIGRILPGAPKFSALYPAALERLSFDGLAKDLTANPYALSDGERSAVSLKSATNLTDAWTLGLSGAIVLAGGLVVMTVGRGLRSRRRRLSGLPGGDA